MSWESTTVYYQLLNQGIRTRLGGLHSAKLLLHSVEFNEIAQLQHHGDWEQAATILTQAAQSLEAAGAQGLIIATNTMHKLADEVTAQLSIPLLHIADATGAALKQAGHQRVGLLATAFTMEQEFYKGHIQQNYAVEVLIPDENDRMTVHDIIYQQLCQGIVKAESRTEYIEIIEKLKRQGAQAVILGCTEIDLLISQADTHVPVFDSTALHVDQAIDWMLDE